MLIWGNLHRKNSINIRSLFAYWYLQSICISVAFFGFHYDYLRCLIILVAIHCSMLLFLSSCWVVNCMQFTLRRLLLSTCYSLSHGYSPTWYSLLLSPQFSSINIPFSLFFSSSFLHSLHLLLQHHHSILLSIYVYSCIACKKPSSIIACSYILAWLSLLFKISLKSCKATYLADQAQVFEISSSISNTGGGNSCITKTKRDPKRQKQDVSDHLLRRLDVLSSYIRYKSVQSYTNVIDILEKFMPEQENWLTIHCAAIHCYLAQ